jgi:glutaredoxin-related protein
MAVMLLIYVFLLQSSQQVYDVYRDSNVTEVVKCRSVLDDLLKRVNQLLAEFPEWPTLVQVFTDSIAICNEALI